MAGNLSPQAQQKISALRSMEDKVQHVYGLVERFAATREARQAEMLAQPLKRAFGRLKLELMGAGFDSMSQLAGSLEIAAGRGGNPQSKSRILREGVGSLKFQIEHEQRKVASEDAEQQRALAGEPQPEDGARGAAPPPAAPTGGARTGDAPPGGAPGGDTSAGGGSGTG